MLDRREGYLRTCDLTSAQPAAHLLPFDSAVALVIP
jgi:hypothetical protein